MADLQELLSSISDEDMAKIKSVADSIMNGNGQSNTNTQQNNNSNNNSSQGGFSLPFDMGTMGKMMSLMGQMNKEDHRTRLICDLKPLLSEERRQKADEAIKFLQLMKMLPLLKGLFGNE